jgi:hypothetical protein
MRVSVYSAAAVALLLAAAVLTRDGPETGSGQTKPGYARGALAKDEPQAIYAADPNDAWNRIFHGLFTHTVKARASDEFSDAGPFAPLYVNSFDKMSLGTRSVERVEPGDRAIEPLYPYDLCILPQGAATALTEPAFAQLQRALTDALQEAKDQPPLARALMQSDAWAAYDVLHRYGANRAKADKPRCEQLLTLLARFVKKLALAPDQIEALPDNYAVAARARKLPDLFAPGSGWMEVDRGAGRIHDHVADYRRATRVFLRPPDPPRDRQAFVNSLRARADGAQFDSVALVVQLLLIDTHGKVVPTHLTYLVQRRTFVAEGGKLKETKVAVEELSRKALLGEPGSTGFVTFAESDPAYLPFAGNDYGFASRLPLSRKGVGESNVVSRESVLVTQRRHCGSCHGGDLAVLMTFSTHESPPPPPALLNPSDNDHGHYIAREKMKRADFEALQRHWGN